MSMAPVEDESARRQRQATHPVRRSLTPVPLSAVAEHGDDATATPGSTAAGHKRASRSAGNVHMMEQGVHGCTPTVGEVSVALRCWTGRRIAAPCPRRREAIEPRAASRRWAELMVPMQTRRGLEPMFGLLGLVGLVPYQKRQLWA